MKIWYLATPYAKFPQGPDAAYEAARANASFLTSHEIQVFSPIVHCHPLQRSVKKTGRFWLDFDLEILKHCYGIIMCKLPSWEISEGMKEEYLASRDKPLYYMTPMTLPAPIEDLL